MTGARLPSLFVIALPRSLSCQVHAWAQAALGLSAPAWTSAGEVLNVGRWRMLAREDDGDRFTTPDEAVRFELWSRFLDDVVQPRGRACKDVVQPFVCAHWLAQPRAHGLRVLRLRRPVADVAWSMQHAGWHYPARAAVAGDDATDRLLSGLLRARDALDAVHGAVEVDFDALLHAPDALPAALARLYPEADLPSPLPAFGDAGFHAHAADVLARRQTPRWRDLAARLERLDAGTRPDRATTSPL